MTEIFNIRHEVDLSEYTSVVDNGGNLTQSTAAALAGSAGGMQGVIVDTGSMYGAISFPQLTSGKGRARFYIDPNSLVMATSDRFNVLIVQQSTASRFFIELNYDGSNYEVRARQRRDDNSFASTAFYNISDEPHFLEVYQEYASSDVASDGRLTFWIDGDLQEQLTGQDVFDLSQPDNARFGVQGPDAGTSGTFYLDEFVLNDDGSEIGPFVGTIPVFMSNYRMRRANVS